MKSSHELARELLEGPDVPVLVYNDDCNPKLVSATISTFDVNIVNGEDVYFQSQNIDHLRACGDEIVQTTAIIL